VRPHELDVVSLLAGLVFLVLGGVGVLQGADVIESGAAWAVIGAVAAVGLTGLVVSVRRLAAASSPAPLEPEPREEPEEEPEDPEESTPSVLG
jgi:hypothetical protein